MTDMDIDRELLDIPVVTDTACITTGSQIHRSNENVCYKGRWVTHPEAGDVVVKKLIVRRSESLNKFEEEVNILRIAQIKDAICHPIAIVRARPHFSILLPFMENGSLEQVLHTKNLPLGLELALCLSLDAAESLEKIHAAGVIHRDIKAANFLVDSDWRVLLTDFGSAKLVDGTQEVDKWHSAAGPTGGFHKAVVDGTTLLYTAPEVLHNREATQKADVYGLAITMAELFTGFWPYNTVEKAEADMHTVLDASYSRQGLRVAICNNGLRPPLGIHRHGVILKEEMKVPEDVNDVIRACWAAKPEERASSADCVRMLKALAEKYGVDRNRRMEYVQQATARLAKVVETVDEMIASSATAPPQPAPSQGRVNITGSGVGSLERGGETMDVNASLAIGAFATSGMRGPDKMEDRHAVEHSKVPGGTLSVCMVLDGHGGQTCAEYCVHRLPSTVADCIRGNLADEAARASSIAREYVRVDQEFRENNPRDKSGATAITLALWDSAEGRRGLVANLGDCRVVLYRRSPAEAVRMSHDQNADDPAECARIQRAGGQIIKTSDGRNRVQGHIQVTRSLGDDSMKPYGVFAEPEVSEFVIDDARDEFMVVATDGLWDVMTDEQVCEAVLKTAREPGLAAKRLGSDAIARGSHDNVSVIVIFLRDLTNDFKVKG